MATTITPVKAVRDPLQNAASYYEFTSVSASGEFEITWGSRDEASAIIVKPHASTNTTITLKAGEGVQGNKDMVIDIAGSATKFYVIPFKSGRFKNDYGTNKGKVLGTVGSGAGVSIAVVEYDA